MIAAQVAGYAVLRGSHGGVRCTGLFPSPTSLFLSPTSSRCQTPPRSSFGIHALSVSAFDPSPVVSSSPMQLVEPDFVSALRFLDPVSSSARVNFEGHVLVSDKGPRLVPIKNQKSVSEPNKPFVMNALLFDSTGPVMLTFCGGNCNSV